MLGEDTHRRVAAQSRLVECERLGGRAPGGARLVRVKPRAGFAERGLALERAVLDDANVSYVPGLQADGVARLTERSLAGKEDEDV